MAISSAEKCSLCRFPCKSDTYKAFCKFYPQNEYLGNPVHFKDPNESKHEITSRMCVVCKEYVNYRKTHWKKEKDGWYPFCKECVKTALFIDESVLKS